MRHDARRAAGTDGLFVRLVCASCRTASTNRSEVVLSSEPPMSFVCVFRPSCALRGRREHPPPPAHLSG